MLRPSMLWLLVGLALMPGAASAAAVSASVSVTATVLSKSQCWFNTGTATLAFGNIDPTSPSPLVTSTSIALHCGGAAPQATFSVSQNGGANKSGSGGNQMLNAAAPSAYQLLPYTVGLTPSSATVTKNVDTLITITGTIAASDAANAYLGSYTDSVVLTVVP